MLLATPSVDSQGALSTVTAIHPLLCLIQELISQQRTLSKRLTPMELAVITTHHHLEVAGLTGMWNGLPSVVVLAGREHLTKMGSVLCETVYALNQRSLFCVVPIAETHWSVNQG